MYGHSCGVVGRGGVGPPRFGGASICWGRSVTTHTHRSVGIPQVRWVHLARQNIDVHDRLEGFPQLVVSPRSVEPLLE